MPKRVSVTERALMQRINRKLHEEGRCVKKTRGERAWTELGACYVLDCEGNYIVEHHVDVEDLGRELEVLRDWEVLKGE
ncbi:MAG TPA: hypothetical protein VMJ93_12095 [Verrucomicrobiae bacterium]|nr:hypothetical protein [Verrucomicrobiae bacterium]